MEKLLARTMLPPYFPVPYEEIKAAIEYQGICASRLAIDTMDVATIPISHPNMGLGFRFEEDGKRFVFLTDNEPHVYHRGGLAVEDYVEFARGADLLVHDAEYTPGDYRLTKGWGHALYTDALDIALRAEVRAFGLFHHNQDRDDQGIDAMVRHCRQLAGERGRPDLSIFGVTQKTEVSL
jgi:ribonuclease BN (tRNA processing enzyme)